MVESAKNLPFFLRGKKYLEGPWLSALRLLTDCLVENSKKAEDSQLLNNFVNNLRDGDIVVTFNWDNLIERTLLLQSRRVNFLSRDTEAVTILKLHGSLNWIKITKGFARKHPEYVNPEYVTFLSERVVCTRDFSYDDIWNVLDMPPLIVPPVLSKHVPVGSFFKEICHEALNSIIDAESVSIIGYSIPNDDLQARSLLRIAWAGRNIRRNSDSQPSEDKYILIDPNPAICGKYASLVSGALDYHQANFSDKLFHIIFGNHLK